MNKTSIPLKILDGKYSLQNSSTKGSASGILFGSPAA
jgi:hypothetical protein